MDEAQHLGDKFLLDLSGFLNFTFDSRDLLTMWLVGLPELEKTLARQEHAPLAMRVSAAVHFGPFTDKEAFATAVDELLAPAARTQKPA